MLFTVGDRGGDQSDISECGRYSRDSELSCLLVERSLCGLYASAHSCKVASLSRARQV